MKLGPKGLAVLQEYEQGPNGGFAPSVYQDDTGNGTIGWGHKVLAGETFPIPMSRIQADELLTKDAESKVRDANALLNKVGITPTQDQFDALVCLIFNTGAGIRDGKRGDVADSDIIMYWKQGDLRRAATAFLDWNKGRVKGVLVPLAGLTRRRTTESYLFSTGELKFRF
jgi:lysozyme